MELGSRIKELVEQLLKGDVEKMEKIISEQTQIDMKKMNTYAYCMMICMLAELVLTPILAFVIGLWAAIPFGMLFIASMYFAQKIEKERRFQSRIKSKRKRSVPTRKCWRRSFQRLSPVWSVGGF